MLKSEDRFQEINEKLGCLTYYVQLCNQQGMTNINHLAEDFFCGLLNIIFDVSLENMNYIERNYAAIDLGDAEAGLAIQVTSTSSREKIAYTLEKFFEKEQDQIFNQLIVLIIGKKEAYRKKFQTKRRFRFDPAQDVWDTARLCEEIMQLDDEKQDEVIRYLDDKMDIPKIAPQQPAPEAPAAYQQPGEKKLKFELPNTLGFLGREAELAQLEEMLVQKNDKLFFITGLGGMGKTELAVRFGQNQRQRFKVHFARFVGSFRQTVSQSIALGIENLWLKESRPEEDIYREAMAVLRECGDDVILIIDNADPADGDFDSLKDETYQELCKMNLRLVITTRANVRGGVEVKPMESAQLLEIMHKYVQYPDEELIPLIDEVNKHTLTVDLMARTLDESCDEVTPAMMLTALRNSTLPKEDYPEVATDHNRETGHFQIYAHLRSLFNVVQMDEDSRIALGCATLLPEGGMATPLFRRSLPAGAQEAFKTLEKRGFLRREAGIVTIHPVVRLVAQHELKPTDESCKVFLENLWGNYDKKKFNHDLYSTMAELYTTAAEKLENKRGGWSGRGRALWYKVGQYEKALFCAKMTLEHRKVSLPADDPDLADAYNDMGLVYQRFRDHQGMAEYYGKALEIRQRILEPDHVDLAKSYNNVGVAYEEKGDYRTALTYKIKALEIFEKILPKDDLDLALSYDHVGCTYGDLGDHRKELEYQEKALRIREKVLPPDHPDLATSYNNVGNTYGALGDHRKALEYEEKALRIWEQVLPPDHPDLALSYNNVGCVYGKLRNYPLALEYLEKARCIYEAKLPPGHPDIKMVRDNIAYCKRKLERPKWMDQIK